VLHFPILSAYEATGEKKTPFEQEETSIRTRTRKGVHLPRPAGGWEDRKEGTTSTITPGQRSLLRERNTS